MSHDAQHTPTRLDQVAADGANSTSDDTISSILTPYVLRHLAQHNVHTVLQFQRCSERELHQRANLSADDVRRLRAVLRERVGPAGSTALHWREQRRLDSVVLSTGLKSLDELLSGGLPTGCVTELCGPTCGGKTLLADAVALHCVRTLGLPVYHISTKRTLSAKRWFAQLSAGVGDGTASDLSSSAVDCSGGGEQPQRLLADAMARLRCESAPTLPDLVRVLRALCSPQAATAAHRQCRMVIVDSLSSVLVPYQHADEGGGGDGGGGTRTHKAGMSLMCEALRLLRQLAAEQQKCVLVETLVLPGRHLSTIARCWPSFAALRLFVKQSALTEDNCFEIQLTKSTLHRSSGPAAAAHRAPVRCSVRLGQ